MCARGALYNGEYPKAEQELQQAIGLQATSLPAWEALAMVQQSSGDLSEAAETYERLVSPVQHRSCYLLAAPYAGCRTCTGHGEWSLLLLPR